MRERERKRVCDLDSLSSRNIDNTRTVREEIAGELVNDRRIILIDELAVLWEIYTPIIWLLKKDTYSL